MIRRVATQPRLNRLADDTSGIVNIVILAAALPILILLLTAAADIVRVPLVKQAMIAAIQNAVTHFRDATYGSELHTGMDWCMLIDQPENNPKMDCPVCPQTNFYCPKAPTQVGSQPLNAVAGKIRDYLINESLGGLSSVNVSDIDLYIELWNFHNDERTAPISEIDNGQSDKVTDTGTSYGPVYDFTSFIAAEFNEVSNLAPQKFEWGTTGVTAFDTFEHVSVLLIQLSVTVDHTFTWTNGILAGDAGSDADTSIIEVLMIYPIPRTYRLTGEEQ